MRISIYTIKAENGQPIICPLVMDRECKDADEAQRVVRQHMQMALTLCHWTGLMVIVGDIVFLHDRHDMLDRLCEKFTVPFTGN